MQLNLMTWPEVDACLGAGACAMLPIGSVEQHGPMGLIGTDTICANEVALRAAPLCDAIVAPPIAYTPAPFNTAFPGTVSISTGLMRDLVTEVCNGLLAQGFHGVFVVNGHGANLAPVAEAMAQLPPRAVTVQSWWAPSAVNTLRRNLYGSWEGMHATPSEVAMTQALYGARATAGAETPPAPLSGDYMRAHSGDRHGPPDEHRATFPDGRVGSHSALATPQDGATLLAAAARAIADEFRTFCDQRRAAAG